MAQPRQFVHEFASPSYSENSQIVFDLSYPLTSLSQRQNVQCIEEDNEPLRDPGAINFDSIKENLRQIPYTTETLPDIRTTFQHFNLPGDFTMPSQHFLHQKFEDFNFSSPDIFNRLFPVYLPISRSCSPQHETVPPHQRSSYSELSANVAFLNDLERDRSATPLRPTESQPSCSRSASPGTPKNSPRRLKHRQPFPTSVRRAPQKNEPQKKQQMACFFCRERKIACGGPVSNDGDDKTCKQCKTRGKTCQYAAESRRGQHRRNKRLMLTSGDPED